MSINQNHDIGVQQLKLPQTKFMKLSYTTVSETGLRRSNNEDAVLFYTPEKPWIEQAMGMLGFLLSTPKSYRPSTHRHKAPFS